eukprot:9490965-Pyramimonas_sp.AAC.1
MGNASAETWQRGPIHGEFEQRRGRVLCTSARSLPRFWSTGRFGRPWSRGGLRDGALHFKR